MVIVNFDRTTHTYTDGSGAEFPSVTRILSHAGIVNFDAVREDIRERALTRGTSVHWVTQLYDEGILNGRAVPKALRGYYNAWKLWRDRSGFTPLLIEKPFLSPWGYAGTADRYGGFPDMTFAVVDIKTGEGTVANWVRYQLAAYSHWYAFVKTTTVRRIAIKLHSDGSYNTREFGASTFNYDLSVFHKALNQWRADANRSTGSGITQ